MFKELKQAVRANFDKLAQKNDVLFYVEIDRDEIWNKYIDNIAEASRNEYVCSACRQFLRQYSGVTAIVNNKRVSIWDNITPPDEFVEAVAALRGYISVKPITDIFLTPFAKCGVDRNKDKLTGKEWEHFFFLSPSKFMCKENDLASKLGTYRENRNLFKRGLDTISIDALETVLELIAQGSLYKGPEYLTSLNSFKEIKISYDTLSDDEEKELFAWKKFSTVNIIVATIRNSSIGTLLIDLSEGTKTLEGAVESFEQKVAGTNYKRTTALVSPKQIANAKAKLEEKGMLGSLERRFAVSSDLDLEDILFKDKSSDLVDPFEELSSAMEGKVIYPKELSKVEEITIEKFIDDVLPLANKVELYLQPEHLGKMVSLITAVDPTTPSLFKWNNLFSWSYTGGITDAIKERVKAAGGQTVGELRVSLSWSNYDDLDLWVECPDGTRIGYNTYRFPSRAANGGQLDVDMNAGSGKTRTPVENIIFPNAAVMPEGVYKVKVNQFSKRESTDRDFTVQIECRGELVDFYYPISPNSSGAWENVTEFTWSRANGIKFNQSVESKVAVKEKWGVKTHSFYKVSHVMLSPNFWKNRAEGNKHFMFTLEDCVSDETPIPFFNEFLHNDFREDRKTFEMLAGKFPVAASPEQLSGVGFSETIASEVILRVSGKFKRLLKIKF